MRISRSRSLTRLYTSALHTPPNGTRHHQGGNESSPLSPQTAPATVRNPSSDALQNFLRIATAGYEKSAKRRHERIAKYRVKKGEAVIRKNEERPGFKSPTRQARASDKRVQVGLTMNTTSIHITPDFRDV